MTSCAPPTAAQRVFHIPELLELVLFNLSTRDLLISQRTARCTRDTTQGSVVLRRKLFLEPDWELGGRIFDTHAMSKGVVSRPGYKPENNRLLLRAFPGCYPTITLVIVSDGANRQPRSANVSNASVTSKNKASEQWSWDVCISFPADGSPSVAAAVDYPEASWRKMYLSQPPCPELYLVRRWQRGLKPAIVRRGGITFGDFVDEATRPTPECEGRNWHSSYISSDRDWHFEGNIKCNSQEASTPEEARKTMIRLTGEYAHSSMLCNDALMALSDDWDSGHAVEFPLTPRATPLAKRRPCLPES